MHLLAFIADSFTNFTHNLRKLLHGVFNEIDLTVVILLNPIETRPILSSNLFNFYIDQLDCSLVLNLIFDRLSFHFRHLRLKYWSWHGHETRRFLHIFLAENSQLLHGVEVVFFRQEHLSSRLMKALPNIVSLLD